MEYRRAEKKDEARAAALMAALWGGSPADMAETFSAVLKEGGAVFLAQAAGEPVGFAQVQLRRDYVEGARTSPVGYLEGLYVREGFRRRGAATALVALCQDWAKAQGCQEFASDCELGNEASQAFHQAAGFTEANRIVCFVKKL